MTPDELLAEPIRRSLWRMGWEALRPLQVQAIQAILGTPADLILAARTAAGKTEAAFLPILSQISEAPIGSIRALYVGPLKALINDQFRRLEELCEYAEIPVHRWHGDVSSDQKKKLVQRPGGVLLITPESLESLLINRSAALAKIFHSLSFVVIDELHALIGRERGTQLRSQLFRLDRHTVTRPRLVALSATIGDLVAAADWLRPDNAQSVQVVKDESGEKVIRFRIHGYSSVPDQSDAADDGEDSEVVWTPPPQLYRDIYENYRGSKNLIFANSKSTVEQLTDRLNELGRQHKTGEEFLIHHGSLAKEIREDTEQLMQGQRPFTTICSSTLELGIDIGNVRAVGQVDPCWSVSSLVQRLGRSGRGDGEPHQMRMFITENPPTPRCGPEQRIHPDLLHGIALTELMLDRWCESPNISPFDLSTLLQQTLSLIAETGGAEAAILFDRLVRRGAFRYMDQKRFALFLRGLALHDLIEQQPNGPLILGLVGEQIVRHYDFYAAFVAPPEYRVLYDGRVLGRLSSDAIPPPDDHIILAGKRWVVVAVDHEKEEVFVRPAKGRKPPLFPPSDGDVAPEIRQKMRAVLQDVEIPQYLDSHAQSLLADARAQAKNYGLDTSDILPLGANRVHWFPWTSSRAMRTLDLLFRWAKIPAEIQSRALSFQLDLASAKGRCDLARLVDSPPTAEVLSKEVVNLERRKWDRFVPRELLEEAFAKDRLEMPLAVHCLKSLITLLKK